MSGQIFISYRREETRWSARSLNDRLSASFGPKQIFMDIDAIALGEDFVRAIETTVAKCDVLIAVIGNNWLTSKDDQGGRRLDNPEDFVRMEIATALKREIRVIPVLVDGALMPRSTELPDDLKPLVRRNALRISDTSFDGDCQRLVAAMKEVLEKAATERREREEQQTSTPSGKLEVDKPATATPKVVSPLPPQPVEPKPVEPKPEKPPPSSSGGSGRKSLSKQLKIVLGVAAALLFGGLIYLAFRSSQSPPAQPSLVTAATPTPVIATPPVEEKASTKPGVTVQPFAKPTAPVGVVTPSPAIVATPSAEESAPRQVAVTPPQPTASSPTPSEADWLAGKRYFDRKDFERALPPLQRAADAGNKEAMSKLADLYYDGTGVAQDYSKAREWYQKAADAGYATAMNNLGWLYENGKGVTRDYGKAREWYQKAADAGDTNSKQALARLPPSPAIIATPSAQEQALNSLTDATKDHPWVNSLGMKFVPVAGTQVLFSIWDTRVQDFETFVKSTDYDAIGGMYSLGWDGWKQRGATWKEPGFSQGANHPVVGVSWIDAEEFCKWLTKRERSAGDLPEDREYRLPTDEEWSAAVGLKNEAGSTPEEKSRKIKVYPWDIPQKRDKSWPPPKGAGNYAGEEAKNGDWPSEWPIIEGYNDGYPQTSPVGSFSADQFGLYDMGGNVWQWCEDWYNAQAQSRVLRGASWVDFRPDFLLASYRDLHTPDHRNSVIGFRCVVAVESSP